MIEIAKLNRHTKLYDTGQTTDGKKVYRAVIQKGQHYLDPNTGRFEDVNANWEFESGFGYKVKKADHNLRIYNNRLRFGFAKGVFVEYTLPVKTPGFAGSECLIPDAWQYVDLRYTAYPEGIKGDIILKQPGHQSNFVFPVSLTGCTAQQKGSALAFYSKGEPVGRIPAPYAMDANGERGPVSLVYDGVNVVITPDAVWLSSAVYPVTIDPTTTLQPDAAGKDAYVYQNAPDNNYGVDVDIQVLNAGAPYIRISYLQFDLAFLSGATINSATLSLYDEYWTNSSGFTVNIRSVTSNWDEGGITWNVQPTYNSTIRASATITTVNRWYDWDIKSLVQDWASGTVNYGMRLSIDAPSTYPAYFASSDHTNATLRPKLIIDYTEASGSIGASVFGSINALGRRLIS